MGMEENDRKDWGVYVHVPYCAGKCLYCDFYSVGARLADWKGYVDALLEERDRSLERMDAACVARTVYIGGGTPSLIPPDEFGRLARGLLAGYGRMPLEFTLEVNPDDVTMEKVKVWKECGVDRISIGVQSMNDDELRFMGRRHDREGVLRAWELLRNEFGDISVDLMFGVPGQTMESVGRTVRETILLSPEHVSAYSLMYEEGTALTRMRDSGMVGEMEEQDNVGMFRLMGKLLCETGYERYELSNYAKPGFRSRHNSGYWEGRPYIGLGPGAHGYDGGRRRVRNLPDVKRYMAYWRDGVGEMPCEEELLSEEELCEEMIMTRLRMSEGLDLGVFGARFGEKRLLRLTRDSRQWIDSGLLATDGRRVWLTEEGVMVSDMVISSLF